MMEVFFELLGLARRVAEREDGALDVLVDALLERGILDAAVAEDPLSRNVRARRWANGCVLVARRPELFRRAAEHARTGERTLVVTTWRADATKLGHLRDSDPRLPKALRFSWVDAVLAMCREGDDAMLRDSDIFVSVETARLLADRELGVIVVDE